jgi:transcriptional regulator with XRE-family HTH domain
MTASGDDATVIELREALAGALHRSRLEQGLTQAELARRLRTSQSRVAKMEAGEAGVTLDLLVKALASLGDSKLEIAKAIIRPMPARRGG